MSAKLLSSLKICSIEVPNRVMMSPMCQYSAVDGFPNEWHFVHYGTRAVGKVGIIMQEATAIEPIGRITPQDLGIWSDEFIEPYDKITDFIISQGSIPAIQIAHAGRKASCAVPWAGSLPLSKAQGGWDVVGPSPIPFALNSPTPKELSIEEIECIKQKFIEAAKRALLAGFKIIEIHSAHGYLLHEFLSPLSNQRQDKYGGSLENRQRLLLEIAKDIRQTVPQELPVFVRISATDWTEGGWNLDDTVNTVKKLQEIGINLIDVSSGGNVANLQLPEKSGFQVPFCEHIKKEINILTSAVGIITTPNQANNIIKNRHSDIVALGRELLRNPYWMFQAGKDLGIDIEWPNQYLRAK